MISEAEIKEVIERLEDQLSEIKGRATDFFILIEVISKLKALKWVIGEVSDLS